jgi:hypothetical protein
MDKFGMYKRIPAAEAADAGVLNEAHDYTAAPDYAAGNARDAAETAAGAQAAAAKGKPETPADVGRRIAAAGASGPKPIAQRKPPTPAVRAYLDMQRRHARLSEAIDRKFKE